MHFLKLVVSENYFLICTVVYALWWGFWEEGDW